MKRKSVAVIGSSVERAASYEFSGTSITSSFTNSDIDPIIGIDHFRMRTPYFEPHPHAGFCAITYLFEDSEGDFVSRDSLGGHIISKPGGVIWNVAGSGIIHDEYPKVTGEMSNGLQMFINLSSSQKQQKPRVLFVDGDEMPVYRENGATVRVIAGSAGNVQAKIQPPENITFLDIHLSAGGSFEKPLPTDEQVLLYVIGGSVFVGEERTKIEMPQTATLNFDGETVFLTADENAHLVLIAGKPHREKLVSYGPFIMNNEEQIQSAIQRYHTGKMGLLEEVNR